ncbi:MAG: beta strand repeat-containing protein [Microcystis panniformis]
MANNFNWIDATTLNGTLWDNGTLSSVTSITQIGTLTIGGTSVKFLNAQLNNTGNIIAKSASTGDLRFQEGAILNNFSNFELQQGDLDGLVGGVGTFNNSGTFKKTTTGTGRIGVVFNNNGTVNVEFGRLYLTFGGVSNGGTFNVNSGQFLGFGGSGQVYTLSNGAKINGTGDVSVGEFVLKLSENAAITNTIKLTIDDGDAPIAGATQGFQIDKDWTLPAITKWKKGTIKSLGIITNSGNLTIEGGMAKSLNAQLNNTGNIIANFSFDMVPNRAGLYFDKGAILNNSGTFKFQSGNIGILNGAVFNNSGNFEFANTGDIDIKGIAGASVNGIFNNSGTVKQTSNARQTTQIGIIFNNTGTVNVEFGRLDIAFGGVSNGGTFNVNSGQFLGFGGSGQVYTLSNGAKINGTGNLTILDGKLDLKLSAGATIANTIKLSLEGISELLVDQNWTLPTITNWEGGTLNSTGILSNSGTLTIGGTFLKFLKGQLNNTGNIIAKSASELRFQEGAILNNFGNFELERGDIGIRLSTGTFNNSGTFKKTTTGTGRIGVVFNNTGTVEVQSGRLNFSNYIHNNANLILKGGVLTFSNPLNINGGSIEGNGTINVAVTNSGLLNPRYVSNTEFGRLTINGNYTETNNASINIQLGGNTAAVNFDQIDINGTANFDGTLNVSLLNGFTPTLGSTFDVLTYDALNSLSNLDFTGLDINSTLQFLPQWSSNKLTLKVVDKSAPILAIAPTNVVESESHSGTKPFTFTVTRAVNTTGTNNVNWAVTGTGTNPANATDFVGGLLPSGTLSFAAGETSKVITVNVQGDTTVEPNETFRVTLSNATNGATITTATATGTIQNDDFIGTSGPDTLAGTSGADAMTGLAGNDTYTVNDAGDLVIEALNEGTDTVQASISYTLPNNVENLLLTGTGNLDGTGNTLNNQITGNSGNNSLNGAAGIDTLIGGAGNDSLNGAAGIDTLTGGVGTDIFIFQFSQSTAAALDRVTDFAIGTDKIDLLSQAGAAINAPGAFTRATDSTTTNINTIVTNVFTDADGATAGNQALGTNSAVLVRDNSSSTYLIINDGTAGFQSANDLVINLTGLTGTLPALGTIAVNSFFV